MKGGEYMPKLMNAARIASGVLMSETGDASSSLNTFLDQYIKPMANNLGTALIAVVGVVLSAMVGFLTVKYGLQIALQWIRKMLHQ